MFGFHKFKINLKIFHNFVANAISIRMLCVDFANKS